MWKRSLAHSDVHFIETRVYFVKIIAKLASAVVQMYHVVESDWKYLKVIEILRFFRLFLSFLGLSWFFSSFPDFSWFFSRFLDFSWFFLSSLDLSLFFSSFLDVFSP